MKKSSGEYKTALNLITPSPLSAIIRLKTLRIYLLALVLLVSGVVGFPPSIRTLANPEDNSSMRIEVPEIPEVPGDPEDSDDSDDPDDPDDPDYPDYSDYPDHSEDQGDPEHLTGTFSVRAVLPENQINDRVRFFYLETEPGQEQTISVNIENFTGEYQTIEVAIHLATTDEHGRVNYSGSPQLPDATLPHNIEDIVGFEPFIQLAPYETVEFWMNIRMPIESYQGVLAGGLTFASVDDILPPIVMAILMVQGGYVEPQLVLAGVSSEVVGTQSVIHANLRNIAASFAGELSITTEVRDYTGALVFTNTREGMHMAPNSSFIYEVGLDDLQMSSELYEVTFVIEEEEGEDGVRRSWELTWPNLQGTGTAAQEVEIEEEVVPEPIQEIEEEEQLPEPPTMLDEESIYNILLLLLVIAGIFVFAFIVVSVARNKKEKANDFMELQEQILATLRSDEETSLTLELEPEIEEIQPFKEERQLFKEERIEPKSDRASEEKSKIPETKEKAVNGKDKDIENKKRELEKKEKEIARIKRELENKEKTLRSKEKTIEEKEKELERKEIEKKERVTKKVRTLERKREEWEIDI